jgi:hypothetical protein
MDLQKLQADLDELDQRFLARNGEVWRLSERELEASQDRLDAVYHPRNSIRPLLNNVIAAYVVVSAEERATIRELFRHSSCGSYGLMDYILECAECLETPDDVDVFRLALIAASIQDCAHDFRDTHAVLAELALSAVKAGIVMESDCAAIAELSSTHPSTGGCQPMKLVLAGFPAYAPKATRLF